MAETGWSAGKRIAVATAIAGTLDICAAMILTLIRGGDVAKMLRFVASGPLPDAPHWGVAGAVAGLVTHYLLMAIMAAAFVLAADRVGALKRPALVGGVVYGLITYVAMNLVVVPLRFHTTPTAVGIATQLFCHIVLVGIPIALVARRG